LIQPQQSIPIPVNKRSFNHTKCSICRICSYHTLTTITIPSVLKRWCIILWGVNFSPRFLLLLLFSL